ncbi:MAG: hypothetical protein PVJ38_00115 [Candidatus Bathyarchaeota archaeon]
MATVNQIDQEVLAYSLDASSELPASPETVIESLKELQEGLNSVSALIDEEEKTIDTFLESLKRVAPTVSKIPLEPTALPNWLGEIEGVRVSPEGLLILTRPGGEFETLDISESRGREILEPLLEDLMPKLRGLQEGTYKLPETLARETLEEPEPEEEEVPEPEVTIETVEHEEESTPEEPPVLKEPIEKPIEEYIPPTLPEPVPERAPTGTPDEKVVETPTDIEAPEKKSDVFLRRYRDKTRRRKHRILSKMAEIRRERDHMVERMRTVRNRSIRIPLEKRTGVLGFLKRLLSRETEDED